MRIIDSNTDYYDYLQNVYRDDSMVFDRRDSFLLAKQIFCSYLKVGQWYTPTKGHYPYNENFALLQICNAFWLFYVNIIKRDQYENAAEYKLDLIANWTNYDKQRKLINLDIINLGYKFYLLEKYTPHDIADTLIQFIDTDDYHIWRNINKHTIYVGDKAIEKHIPLLKACGIAEWIDPLNIYLALEEYFSLEKSSSERRDPIGTTDKDKIESHGFDTKISFRGKN